MYKEVKGNYTRNRIEVNKRNGRQKKNGRKIKEENFLKRRERIKEFFKIKCSKLNETRLDCFFS